MSQAFSSMKRSRKWPWLLLLLPLALGIARLRFDVEILNLLPEKLAVAQGLKIYQQNFSNARELIITLEAPTGDEAESAARALAQWLRARTNLVTDVTWQPAWMENPAEALELIKKKTYDVVICDQRMPGLSGQRLYRLVETLNPELQHRFLFVTGDVVNAQTKRFFLQAGVQFLRKPFRIQDLIESVETLINRNQPQGF